MEAVGRVNKALRMRFEVLVTSVSTRFGRRVIETSLQYVTNDSNGDCPKKGGSWHTPRLGSMRATKKTRDRNPQSQSVGSTRAIFFFVIICSVSSFRFLCSPNEDVGSLNKRSVVHFRYTLQGCEYSIRATNPCKLHRTATTDLLFRLPTSLFGEQKSLPQRRRLVRRGRTPQI